MTYGYARVSTKNQKLERQIENITREYPDAILMTEKFTGTTTDRPEWNKLMKKVRANDTIIFDSVSRMSRNKSDGVEDYFDLFDKGVELVFLKEPHINTSVYRLLIASKTNTSSFKAQVDKEFEFAEKECYDIRSRVHEGMMINNAGEKISKARQGKKFPRKSTAHKKRLIAHYSRDFEGTLIDKDVMKLIDCPIATYYRLKKELKTENKEIKP